jgi:hypothetical protein
MISQENSGLAEVIPVDYINETIKAYRQQDQQRATLAKPLMGKAGIEAQK